MMHDRPKWCEVYGKYNEDPFLSSHISELVFSDKSDGEYGDRANMIAENMLMQVNSEGYGLSLMESTADHQKGR